MLPLVSVVTVAKNAGATIAETIESVLSQDYPRLEYVVVDGASTDGTADIVKRYGDRIAVFVSEPDSGMYFAMQKGIGLSTGSLVWLLNADDRFSDAHSVASLVEARLSSGINGPVICYSNYRKYYPQLRRSVTVLSTEDLHTGMRFWHQASIADRSAYDRVGGFDLGFRLAADFDWAVRAKKAGVRFIKFAGPPTAIFRHGGMSERHYRLSHIESERIIRREYGWLSYARYAAKQRCKFFLRSISASLESLCGRRLPGVLQNAYLRIFRKQREFDPVDQRMSR